MKLFFTNFLLSFFSVALGVNGVFVPLFVGVLSALKVQDKLCSSVNNDIISRNLIDNDPKSVKKSEKVTGMCLIVLNLAIKSQM